MAKTLAQTKPLSITNFFSWDTSLADKDVNGHLAREIPYYVTMAKNGVRLCSLTWGTERDLDIARGKKFPAGTKFIPFHAVIPRPGNKVLRLLLSPFILWPARRAIRGCDLLRTEQMVGGWCAVLAKFIFRKPLIVRTGYEFHKFTVARGKGLSRRFFSYIISKVTYLSADLVFVTSRDDRDFAVKRFGIQPDRIKVLPNWTDTKKFSPSGKARAKGEILFVGRIDSQKNLPLLIEAVAGTEWRLTIIGDGPLKAGIEKLAAEQGVQARFLGIIPNNDLVAHYRRCAVYVLPSRFEGHPKTLLEAMACGCAVLGTDVDGIGPVINHGEDGILVEESAASLRMGITKLMGDASLRKRLGNAAAQKIRDTLNPEKILGDEATAYRDVLGRLDLANS